MYKVQNSQTCMLRTVGTIDTRIQKWGWHCASHQLLSLPVCLHDSSNLTSWGSSHPLSQSPKSSSTGKRYFCPGQAQFLLIYSAQVFFFKPSCVLKMFSVNWCWAVAKSHYSLEKLEKQRNVNYACVCIVGTHMVWHSNSSFLVRNVVYFEAALNVILN